MTALRTQMRQANPIGWRKHSGIWKRSRPMPMWFHFLVAHRTGHYSFKDGDR